MTAPVPELRRRIELQLKGGSPVIVVRVRDLAAVLDALDAADALAADALASGDPGVVRNARRYLAARGAHLTEGTPDG